MRTGRKIHNPRAASTTPDTLGRHGEPSTADTIRPLVREPSRRSQTIRTNRSLLSVSLDTAQRFREVRQKSRFGGELGQSGRRGRFEFVISSELQRLGGQ